VFRVPDKGCRVPGSGFGRVGVDAHGVVVQRARVTAFDAPVEALDVKVGVSGFGVRILELWVQG
jgi:hypothetical protein